MKITIVSDASFIDDFAAHAFVISGHKQTLFRLGNFSSATNSGMAEIAATCEAIEHVLGLWGTSVDLYFDTSLHPSIFRNQQESAAWKRGGEFSSQLFELTEKLGDYYPLTLNKISDDSPPEVLQAYEQADYFSRLAARKRVSRPFTWFPHHAFRWRQAALVNPISDQPIFNHA